MVWSSTGQVDFNPIEHKYHLLKSRRLKQAQNKQHVKLPIVELRQSVWESDRADFCGSRARREGCLLKTPALFALKSRTLAYLHQ